MVERDAYARNEEVLRLMASAANAARLYPEASDIPQQTVERFVRFANTATSALGALRYTIEPHGFKIGDSEVGAGSTQISSLAEALHAMQAGQLIIAPDVDAAETRAFLAAANSEPLQVRQSGGLRSALGAAQVTHIAVIEVTLRASDEAGLLGLDLTAAPLDEIAAETAAAAERWARSAKGGAGEDEMAGALGKLEAATRDLAMQRVAQALLRLDEDTRERLLGAALVPDNTAGKRMDGMLEVIARMNPAALARLLTLTAARIGASPDPLLAAMDLPPEVLEQVLLLMRPSACSEADCGIPAEVDTAAMAATVAASEDSADLERQIAVSDPALASGKALRTTVLVSRPHPGLDAVTAIGQALPDAARDGALVEVREALRRLDEMRDDPALTEAADRARSALSDPDLLRDLTRSPLTDADAAVAGEILSAAGPAGAQALLECYVTTDEFRRSLLRPVLRGMSDQVLSVASRMLRSADAHTAAAVLGTLAHLGDRRAVPVIAAALDNMDSSVRRAAMRALADTPGEDSVGQLVKALGHQDPETRRIAAQELGRVHSVQALPALARVLDEIELFERNYELKKEVIKSLESIGSAKAIPVLNRIAANRFAFGWRNKELKFLARNAIAQLSGTEEEKR